MYENERQTDSEESFMEHTEHMDGHQKLLVSCWQVFTDMKKKYIKTPKETCQQHESKLNTATILH